MPGLTAHGSAPGSRQWKGAHRAGQAAVGGCRFPLSGPVRAAEDGCAEHSELSIGPKDPSTWDQETGLTEGDRASLTLTSPKVALAAISKRGIAAPFTCKAEWGSEGGNTMGSGQSMPGLDADGREF
jgi:hypothetical protein